MSSASSLFPEQAEHLERSGRKSRPPLLSHRDIVLHHCGRIAVGMKQIDLFIQCIAVSVIVATAIWATVGAPPPQNSKAQFHVASRR
jgi:hypothetical protein